MTRRVKRLTERTCLSSTSTKNKKGMLERTVSGPTLQVRNILVMAYEASSTTGV
jgi:hypothetical protein